MSMSRFALLHVFKPALAAQLPEAYPKEAREVFDQFWRSGKWVIFLACLAVCVLYLSGRLGPEFPIDWGKIASIVGNLFMGWATWFALWDGQTSWDGGLRPDEVARAGIFRCLITIGIFLSVCGGGWWQ